MVRLLARVIGVGIETADMLVQEALSRNLRDRRAVARYAGLEVLEAQTQWEDLPNYDNESNKWHDSILIARKGPRPRD
jgi:hypothetical protein